MTAGHRKRSRRLIVSEECDKSSMHIIRIQRQLSNTIRISPRCGRAKSVALALLLMVAIIVPYTAVTAADAELKIEPTLDRSSIALGEQTSLRVSISGPSGFSEPDIPQVSAVDITLQGRTQSVQILNMKVESSKIFTYAVVPRKVGEFSIGPVRIKRRGQTYESKTVKLSVTESVQEQADTEPRNVIVEATVDNTTPYIGQQITLLFRFARSNNARIRNAGYQMPDLTDFWNEGAESKHEYRQRIDGVEYLVTEIAIPLFPMREGAVTIDEIAIHYDEVVASKRTRPGRQHVDPFGRDLFNDDFFDLFRSEQLVRQTRNAKPIEINVRPLPAEGRPENFKGGIGSFSATARLSEEEVKAGESVTLTVVISGQGNIRDLSDPDLEIKGVKTYSDTPSVDVKSFDDKIMGEKVFKLALVPQEAGEIEIPNVSIPFFNPESKRYEIAASAPLKLSVLPSSEESLPIVPAIEAQKAGARIALPQRDILPIHERFGPITSSRYEAWLSGLRPITYPLPLIIYAACFVYARRKEKLRTDTAFRRRTLASKTADHHIKNAANAFNSKKWDMVFTECSRAVTEYLADKLNVPASGLTPADIESALSAMGMTHGLLTELVQFLEGCDYRRFASSGESAHEARNYIDKAHRIIERLEQERTINR